MDRKLVSDLELRKVIEVDSACERISKSLNLIACFHPPEYSLLCLLFLLVAGSSSGGVGTGDDTTVTSNMQSEISKTAGTADGDAHVAATGDGMSGAGSTASAGRKVNGVETGKLGHIVLQFHVNLCRLIKQVSLIQVQVLELHKNRLFKNAIIFVYRFSIQFENVEPS